MKQSNRRFRQLIAFAVGGFFVAMLGGLLIAPAAYATVLTDQGSLSVTATVLPNLPTTPAIINSPGDNLHFATTPLVVSGTCQAGLTVRIYDNSALAGTSTCAPDGSFVINITLNIGKNVLTALNFDSFEQAGPVSAAVTVFADAQINPAQVESSQATNSLSEAIGTPPAATVTQTTASQRLFEGTFIEPLAKALGIGQNVVVAPGVNHTIAVAANGAFFVSVIALVVIFAF